MGLNRLKDEALDEATGEGVIDLLWDLNQSDDITLVLVTHDFDLAREADHWVHLHEGHAEQRTQ